MKSPLLRRLAAYSGSVLLGLAGVAVLASPAQAHHTTITAKAKCTPNEWIITWTVENWDTKMSAVIDVVDDKSSPDSAITNIVDGATLPGKADGKLGKLVGEQHVSLDTTTADLTVFGKWTNNNTQTNSGHIALNKAECGNYKADLTGQAACDTETGNWKVSWSAINKHYTDPAKVTIINKAENPNDPKFSAIEFGTENWEPLTDLASVVGLSGGVSIPGGGTVQATQAVPGNATAVRLKIRLNWDGQPGDTQSRVVAFEGTCVKNAPKPSAVFASDCTGVATVTLMNGKDATKAAVFEVKGAGGFTTEKITIQPGEDPVKVTVPKAAATAIEVYENGVKIDEYQAEAKECPSPTPSASPSAPPTLPKTGANVTIFVVAGLLLVAVGFAVFMLARRRRLNLTEV
ncbi:LPXTG cell wall anchor domain-containing protein [Catellatospora vulcania]|uniref:LPXTG cell wall anchor domain-containing protein n=1 Tax=Catellatospora vulcania TaxID=1460450 RepID=UPI0012D38039|nr:LPXTG cell wall anchor domain-containing protein [Catellatospora vulcania]